MLIFPYTFMKILTNNKDLKRLLYIEITFSNYYIFNFPFLLIIIALSSLHKISNTALNKSRGSVHSFLNSVYNGII